jgi:hypothetical protein
VFRNFLGGPIESLSDGLLVGVVSGGKFCDQTDPDFPGVIAKVAFARDWIKKLTKV